MATATASLYVGRGVMTHTRNTGRILSIASPRQPA